MKYSSEIIKIQYFASHNAKVSLALEEGTFLLFFMGFYSSTVKYQFSQQQNQWSIISKIF